MKKKTTRQNAEYVRQYQRDLREWKLSDKSVYPTMKAFRAAKHVKPTTAVLDTKIGRYFRLLKETEKLANDPGVKAFLSGPSW